MHLDDLFLTGSTWKQRDFLQGMLRGPAGPFPARAPDSLRSCPGLRSLGTRAFHRVPRGGETARTTLSSVSEHAHRSELPVNGESGARAGAESITPGDDEQSKPRLRAPCGQSILSDTSDPRTPQG